MLQGLSDLGHAWLSFMNPMTLLYGLGGAFVGIVMGILPGLALGTTFAWLAVVYMATESQRIPLIVTSETYAFSALVVVLAALGVSMAMRSPFRVDVVRDRASLARIVDEGQVENLYRIQVMNATEQDQRYKVRVAGLPELAVTGGEDLRLAPAEAKWYTLSVRMPPQAAATLKPGVHPFHFEVERVDLVADGPRITANEKSTFVVPR